MRDRIVPVDRRGRVAPLAAAWGLAMGLALPALAGQPGRGAPRAGAPRLPALALKCLHQEYPNHISHTLNSDADARPPRELYLAFYGCLDWHSDVPRPWL